MSGASRLAAIVLAGLMAVGATGAAAASDMPVVAIATPETRPVVPATTLVLVNTNDPDSIRLGDAYARARGIPAGNVVRVFLPRMARVSRSYMGPVVERLRADPAFARARAIAVAWAAPYAVERQSITSAITEGLADIVWRDGCAPTAPNAAHDAPAGAATPRPLSMLLIGGRTHADSLALVRRAVRADGGDPAGTVHYVETGDRTRSEPRAERMAWAHAVLGGRIAIELGVPGPLRDKSGILGFQLGAATLPNLDTLRFRPGAFADSLTSFGGMLFEPSGQTPSTYLLEAGATASFGTVAEPCNFPQKFPDPFILLDRYLSGDTIVEAYWKSVAWATEGLFVGEPLARPFAPATIEPEGPALRLKANRQTRPGRYDLYRVETGDPRLVRAEIVVAETVRPGDLLARLAPAPEGAIFALHRRSAGAVGTEPASKTGGPRP